MRAWGRAKMTNVSQDPPELDCSSPQFGRYRHHPALSANIIRVKDLAVNANWQIATLGDAKDSSIFRPSVEYFLPWLDDMMRAKHSRITLAPWSSNAETSDSVTSLF